MPRSERARSSIASNPVLRSRTSASSASLRALSATLVSCASFTELGRSVKDAHDTNVALKARNEALDAEVRDLKTGFDAIEERARSDLGMVRQDEVFFQLQPPPATAAAAGK